MCNQGIHDYDFNMLNYKGGISEKYICKYCKFIYTNVYQADCGCHYCRNCLDEAYGLSSGICQICQENFSEKKIKDKAFQKELHNYQVDCEKCNWNGRLVDYFNHYFEIHKELVCKNCKKNFKDFDTLLEHLRNNPQKSCRKQIDKNKCVFKSIGCNAKFKNINEFDEHMKENFPYHLQQLFDVFSASNNSICEKEQRADICLRSPTLEYINKEFKNVYLSKEKLKNKIDTNRKEITLLQETIKDLKSQLILTQSIIIDLSNRLKEQEQKSYGTFMWKITDVKQKVLESKSGKQTSFYSPPFYSHANGYKMCARIYFNGDGMGRGTHLSVFFVLMKGEFDSLLAWPFKQKVTFVLIDQLASESKENIVDAFRPDPRSTSFKRPDNDMNIASGILLFCSLSKLYSEDHQYLKDDILFLKIIVDENRLIDA